MSEFIDEAISFYANHIPCPQDFADRITYEELDGIDFFNRVKERTGDDSLSDLDSIYIKDEESGTCHFFIKDTVSFQKNNFCLEVLYSQLSNILIGEDRELQAMARRFDNFLFRKAKEGLMAYLSFYAIYLSQFAMSLKYAGSDENLYGEEESKRLGTEILKQALEKKDISQDERMSMVFYAFSKISLYEEDEGVYDLRQFIGKEPLKNPIQQMYSLLAGKSIYDTTIWDLVMLQNASRKVHNLLCQEEF